jgi:hypothetical protein
LPKPWVFPGLAATAEARNVVRCGDDLAAIEKVRACLMVFPPG